MNLTRQMTFWVVTLAVFVVAMWLLRGILLPFVAGMALAYLLDPVANRLERLGVNRLVATLLIIGILVVSLLLLFILLAPVVGAQLASFIQKVPDYVTRLQSTAFRRRSRTNSTDHEVVGWITEDVFHRSACRNRNRKFLAIAVNYEGK